MLIFLRVKVSPNSSKKRKLDEVDSESVPTQLDELTEQPPAKKGKLMPPPLSPSTKKPRSPQRSLFPPSTPSIALIEPNSDHAKLLAGGSVSESDADYQLSLLGDSDIVTRKECASECFDVINFMKIDNQLDFFQIF